MDGVFNTHVIKIKGNFETPFSLNLTTKNAKRREILKAGIHQLFVTFSVFRSQDNVIYPALLKEVESIDTILFLILTLAVSMCVFLSLEVPIAVQLAIPCGIPGVANALFVATTLTIIISLFSNPDT